MLQIWYYSIYRENGISMIVAWCSNEANCLYKSIITQSISVYVDYIKHKQNKVVFVSETMKNIMANDKYIQSAQSEYTWTEFLYSRTTKLNIWVELTIWT